MLKFPKHQKLTNRYYLFGIDKFVDTNPEPFSDLIITFNDERDFAINAEISLERDFKKTFKMISLLDIVYIFDSQKKVITVLDKETIRALLTNTKQSSHLLLNDQLKIVYFNVMKGMGK